MIGRLIEKIRTDKGLTKTELSRLTGINIGHLTHIEKEDRNPSHKTLRLISNGLEVPYQPLISSYDRDLTDDQVSYNVIDHINYSCIPIVNSIIGYSACPKCFSNATFVMRSFDNSMSPKIQSNDFVYIELNAPLNNRDIGLFQYENRLLIRKFIVRKNDLVLRPEEDSFDEIILTKNSDFFILGKILGCSNSNMTDFTVF